ncbi:MAG: NAD(P)-dependent oxidoreductase [Pseudomonadota bacterium]
MSKDWTGNKKSTFSTLGASSHSLTDREQHDYYATEPSVIDDLFKVHKLSDTIWEPACGGGHLSAAMEEYGKSVYSTDLINRGFGNDFFNFLESNISWEGDILTNPPYKYAQEFVEKSLELIKRGNQVVMFLKLTFLEGQKRRKLFEQYPPKYIYVFSARKKCAINGDFDNTGSSAACYAWFIWVKGSESEPIVRWL